MEEMGSRHNAGENIRPKLT